MNHDSSKTNGRTAPTGALSLVTRRDLGDLSMRKAPRRWTLENFLKHRRKTVGQLAIANLAGFIAGLATARGQLAGQVYRADWSRLAPWQILKLKELLAANHPLADLPRHFGGLVVDYGLMSQRVVTTAGVGFIVDAFQNLVELENMKFHGFGTGTNAEASGDTALQTEETTQYATDNTRPTGTTTEGASANIYRTVATYSPDSGGTRAITEHGVLSQAATGGGVLLDRSVFSAVNLVAGSDSLQSTYELTLTAGS